MNKDKIFLFFNTLKYLRLRQLFYRFFYYIKNYFTIEFLNQVDNIQLLQFPFENFNRKSYNNNSFIFLNKEKYFSSIDWDFDDFGELWNFNLHYFDYLNINNIKKEEGLELIRDYIKKRSKKNRFQSYPTSLRIINWIKFLSINRIDDEVINNYLFDDSLYLYNNVEYHLMGNHVLENAFSLLHASFYFKNKNLYLYSKDILFNELDEQILNDGGHFELSTMYHQILLNKILDCIHLMKYNIAWSVDGIFLDFLTVKASSMLGWLDSMLYDDANIPIVNDSSRDFIDTIKYTFDYARNLRIEWSNSQLKESGYRRWNKDKVKVLLDVGQIGASYIPGHAHADTFNFEFIYNSKSIIIDPGVSTYENNDSRKIERSTEYHNTIRINKSNSSEVWDIFKVGNRANVIEIIEGDNYLKATHNGYKNIGVFHQRKFNLLDDSFLIEDKVDFKKNKYLIESYLHFHPDCNIYLDNNIIRVDKKIVINLNGYTNIKIIDFKFPLGFNKTINSKKISAVVLPESSIEINYEN